MDEINKKFNPVLALKKPGPSRRTGLWQIAWEKYYKNPLSMIGLAGFLLIILCIVLAPWTAPYDPLQTDYDKLKQGPSAENLFGTDDVGRDILSRVIWGGRESLRVAIVGMMLSMGGGLVIGLISGYYGGAVDEVIQRLTDVMLAMPSFLLLLSIIAALGPGLTTILIAIAISSIPSCGRLVRASVLSTRNNLYVEASRSCGAKNGFIMARHILPNILPTIIIYTTLNMAGFIMMTTGLSFLGLGAQPPAAEWGSMLMQGRPYLLNAWWMSFFPGLMIMFVVLFINIIGDGLRDALDPKYAKYL